MSVHGTHLAAAVAATTLNAQQLARVQDKELREQRRPGRKMLDTYETHLKVLEEHDEGETTPRLAVDDRMQERPHDPRTDTTPDAEAPKKHLDVTG